MYKLLIVLTLFLSPLFLGSGTTYRLEGEAEREDYIITYQDSTTTVKLHKSAMKASKKKHIPSWRLKKIFN